MSKMIYIDDTEPEGDLEPAFPSRDVTIKRGVNAKELYEIIDEIGRGKFGTVYKCRERATGLTLAAKFVPIPKRDDRRNVEREVEIMNSLQHHLIIQLFAAYEFQKMMCVVLELVEGGELFDRVIEDEFVLSEKVCIVFIRQVCEAMEFIHRNNILHLDLKPENILCLTKEGNRIKVIDFGLARKYDPDKKLQILFGTPEFVAPEVVNFDCITYGTDMWSVGVICYVLISGISPFMGETDIQTMANVTIAKYDFDDESFNTVSPEALDFIAKLLVKDCSIRMTATQCLEHKWLSRRTRAPPLISPKPTNVPPLKLKTIPSPPQTPIPLDVNEDDEPKSVELPKDNIKNFIERWENHPNSPYVFDVESNVITPLRGDSISSSRVCSPSPCESVDSVQTEDGFKNTNNINNNNNNSIYDDNNFNSYGCDMLEPETPTNIDDATAIKLNNSRNFKDYLHSFDRRNSDTNYLLGRRPSGERMNLAEEIRKLSDHLLMLAEINTKMGTGGGTLPLNECGVAKAVKPSDEIKLNLLKANDKSSGNDKRSSTKIKQQNQQETLNENKEKPKKNTVKIKPFQSSLTSVSYSLSKGLTEDSKMASTKTTTVSKTTATTKANKTTTKTSTNLSKTVGSQYSRENTSTKNVSPTLASTSFSDKSKISSLSARLQKSIEEVPKILGNGLEKSDMSLITNRTTNSSIITSTEKESSFPENITKTSSRIQSRINGFRLGLNPAFTSPTMFPSEASLKRMKFRVNSMSRDVPIGLPNTHQTVNLEEAANTTKDCLLHLLEKYNDTKMRNPSGRHQSISVDWNISDNLEYRTMSSINAFFQRNNSSSENVKHLQAQLTGKKKAT